MTLPVILSFISTCAIVTGGIIAVLQLHQMNRQRAREATTPSVPAYIAHRDWQA